MQVEEVRTIRWVNLKEARDLVEFKEMQEVLLMADTYLGKAR